MYVLLCVFVGRKSFDLWKENLISYAVVSHWRAGKFGFVNINSRVLIIIQLFDDLKMNANNLDYCAALIRGTLWSHIYIHNCQCSAELLTESNIFIDCSTVINNVITIVIIL